MNQNVVWPKDGQLPQEERVAGFEILDAGEPEAAGLLLFSSLSYQPALVAEDPQSRTTHLDACSRTPTKMSVCYL